MADQERGALVTKTLPKKLLKAVRAALEAERERASETLEELDETGQLGAWRDSRSDVVDAGTAALEREQSQALAARLQRRLTEIDEALRRLDAGTYGTCEVCGEPISPERLEALPATAFCLEHSLR